MLILYALTFFLTSLMQSSTATPPACRYDDVPSPYQDYADWDKTLLDPIYKLSESYLPPDLEPIPGAGDYQVRSLVLPDLTEMMAGAAAKGVPLAVQSAYRSYAYQAQTFDYWVNLQGREAALKSSARAGHSEHQLGTALDFRSADGPPAWELEDWAQTPAGAWLEQNAWRYGFVMSYPRGKQSVTCYTYEPWHYRYVGKEAARALKETGLTLREWLWRSQPTP